MAMWWALWDQPRYRAPHLWPLRRVRRSLGRRLGLLHWQYPDKDRRSTSASSSETGVCEVRRSENSVQSSVTVRLPLSLTRVPASARWGMLGSEGNSLGRMET